VQNIRALQTEHLDARSKNITELHQQELSGPHQTACAEMPSTAPSQHTRALQQLILQQVLE
jgi:hypothetical protein